MLGIKQGRGLNVNVVVVIKIKPPERKKNSMGFSITKHMCLQNDIVIVKHLKSKTNLRCKITVAVDPSRPAGWLPVTPIDSNIPPFSTRVTNIIDTPSWNEREKEGKNIHKTRKKKRGGRKKKKMSSKKKKRRKKDDDSGNDKKKKKKISTQAKKKIG